MHFCIKLCKHLPSYPVDGWNLIKYPEGMTLLMPYISYKYKTSQFIQLLDTFKKKKKFVLFAYQITLCLLERGVYYIQYYTYSICTVLYWPI